MMPLHNKEEAHAVRMTSKTLTAQIVNCRRQQSWKEAVKLLKYAIRNMQAYVITYNATISASEKGQQWLTAVSMLREMQR